MSIKVLLACIIVIQDCKETGKDYNTPRNFRRMRKLIQFFLIHSRSDTQLYMTRHIVRSQGQHSQPNRSFYQSLLIYLRTESCKKFKLHVHFPQQHVYLGCTKMENQKMRNQIARVANAGLENAGPNCIIYLHDGRDDIPALVQ